MKSYRLGITLSSDATWGEHINNIYKKNAYRISLLRMSKYDLDRKSLKRFIFHQTNTRIWKYNLGWL